MDPAVKDEVESGQLEQRSAEDVVRWALERFGTKVALASSFGAEDAYQLHFAFDVRDLNQSSSFVKKVNFGTEFQFPRYLGFFKPAVRVGANQLYFSGGVTLDFRYAKLEFATYGEEAAQFSRQKQTRRIAFNLGFKI